MQIYKKKTYHKLKIQGIIHLPQFLLSETQVPSGDGSIGMVEQFSQLYQCHLTVFAGHLHDLTTKGLTEAVRAEMLHPYQSILGFNLFQNHIDPLDRDDPTILVQEAFLLGVLDSQGIITLLDVFPHTGIDLDFPMLSSLLLVQAERLSQYLFPGEGKKVGDAESKE